MYNKHNLPYVGIKASEMIKKLNLDFVFTGDYLSSINTLTGEHHIANEYEKKLFYQSKMEKYFINDIYEQ